jgi:signal transduction histidine kinase
MLEATQQGTITLLKASLTPKEDRESGIALLPSRDEHGQKSGTGIDWLSASMIHDLRNPLGTIVAGAEMLISELDPASTRGKRLAANIYRAAGRMLELLAELAAASRGKKSISQVCNLRELILATSAAALQTAENQTVQILNDVPDDIEIVLERARMECVFFNLIVNALEAMPDGGKIGIGVRKTEHSVLIEVEDTGPGIPAKIRSSLFKPFATMGKDHGLGLGLAVSRQTVRDHGGDIWLEPASGARFVLRLPLNRT